MLRGGVQQQRRATASIPKTVPESNNDYQIQDGTNQNQRSVPEYQEAD
jgi:hypothetical protein